MKHLLKANFLFLIIFVSAFLNACQPYLPWEKSSSAPQTVQKQDAQQVAVQEPVYEPISNATLGQKTKIGLLLPLTGRGREIGQSLLNASQLALLESKASHIALIPIDTKSREEGAKQGFNQLKTENVSMVIGPFYSQDVQGVAHKALDAKIPVLAFSNDTALARPGIYMMGFHPNDQVRRIVHYALSIGKSKFAILSPDTPYGRSVSEGASESIKLAGGDLIEAKSYPVAIRDFMPMIQQMGFAATEATQMKKPAFDALILADNKDKSARILSSLKDFNVDMSDVKVLGTGLWDEGNSPDSLYGALYSAPPLKEKQSFEMNYQKAFKKAPPRLASLAYDATALAIVLSQTGNSLDAFTPDKITNPTGFVGIDGVFRFASTGQIERGLAVLEITPQGAVLKDPAPKSF